MANNTQNPTEFVDELMSELNQLSTVTETFKLPTKGRLDNIDENVNLRMMTTHEEKIRTGSRTKSFWKLMADLINRCVVEPKGFDAYNLTVIDFIFLMYKLRIVTYGKDYKVNITSCPICGKGLSDVTIDLDKLEVVNIDDMSEEFRTEPIKIHLPKTGWDIECKLLRINEYDEIQSEVDKMYEDYPNYEGDPMVPLRLARQIVSIKGQKLNKHTVQAIVEKLPADDENCISRTFDKINMGLNLNSKYACPRCGKTFNIPLSMSEEFFRPSSD